MTSPSSTSVLQPSRAMAGFPSPEQGSGDHDDGDGDEGEGDAEDNVEGDGRGVRSAIRGFVPFVGGA